jgi:hypothetical protein
MRNLSILFIASAALALTACGGGNRLGEQRGPDELAISRSAPLVVPSEFNLTPPRPGTPRATGAESQQQAMEALFGPGIRVPPRSPAEQQLLDKAGAGAIEPGIRSNVGDTATKTVDKGAFIRELVSAPAGNLDEKRAVVSFVK